MVAVNKPIVICLMGPTASGKTALALELFEHLPLAIISVDSALVYQGMDIGTAKPEPEVLLRAPHALVDIIKPSDSYSVAQFRDDALQLIAEAVAAEKIPLLVGGTMLYYKALLDGINAMPESDPVVRARIELEAEQQGWVAMHSALASIDADSAKRINPNDPQRLTRALEVYRISGKSMTEWHQSSNVGERLRDHYRVLQFAISPVDRAVLHTRIAERFANMLANGFIEEVELLRSSGDLHADLPAMRAVGYRQVWQYLDGSISRKQMQEKGIVATRQLAKRQLTWLRGWQDLHWLLTDASGQCLVNLQEAKVSAVQKITPCAKILQTVQKLSK